MRTPILQFGTSRFLQAHADLFVSEAMAQGQEVGPITVIQSSGDAGRAKRLSGLVGGYPVRIEGLVDGVKFQESITVRSIARTLSTAADWSEISRIFVEDATHVLSNTGDAGYAPKEADTRSEFDQSMSYPAKLLCLLRSRYEAGAGPIHIMPMELIVDNGQVLKDRILELVEGESAGLIEYLSEEVIWVNSLVDRIVSEPLEPAGAVAEPYALWAIEDHGKLSLPFTHPSVQVVPTLKNLEALKLFVLNLGHSFLADRWLVARGNDDVLVRDLVSDPVEGDALNTVLKNEVRPAFIVAGLGDEFDAYVATTLERFENPYLAHRIADISQNHAQKVSRRIAAFLSWAEKQGDQTPKPILADLVRRNGEVSL